MTGAADRPDGRTDQPDVLASDSARGGRPWLVAVAAVAVLVLAGYLLTRGGDDEPAAAPTGTTVTTTTSPTTVPRRPPQTSAPIDPADVTSGDSPNVFGVQSGGTAILTARIIADSFCQQILTWTARVEQLDGFDRVVVLLRPSGPAYPQVELQFELTWDVDRYRWQTSRTALESCP